MIKADDLIWGPDDSRFTLGDLVFAEVEIAQPDDTLRPGENCFHFHKRRGLVEQYLEYLHEKEGRFPTQNFVELGLFDGGSIPFWFELFEPAKYVGIDRRVKSNPAYLQRYIEKRGLESRLHTHWSTDQSDAPRLREICAEAFGEEPIDLVIDDASHLYEPSLASFETLFPRVRPGGHYVIEDWAWFHWPATKQDFAGETPFTRLVTELVELTGSTSNRVIRQIDIRSGFAVVQRGWTPREELEDFRIAALIKRHSD